MQVSCQGALKAVVHYYPNGVHKTFETTNTPVAAYVRQSSSPTVNCGLYRAKIVIPRYHWSGPNRTGIRTNVDPYRRIFYAYGPIGRLKITETPAANSYYGVHQFVSVECRGLFGGGCQPLNFCDVGAVVGGSGNAYLYGTKNGWIEGIQWFNQQIENPWELTVIDRERIAYSDQFPQEAAMTITCEYCPPGQTAIGCCCVRCEDLTSDLQAIRRAIRGL